MLSTSENLSLRTVSKVSIAFRCELTPLQTLLVDQGRPAVSDAKTNAACTMEKSQFIGRVRTSSMFSSDIYADRSRNCDRQGITKKAGAIKERSGQ